MQDMETIAALHLQTMARVMLGNRSVLATNRLACLQRLIDHTWKHHPLISGWWREHGLEKRPICLPEELASFPITGKSQYQALKRHELIAKNYSRAELKDHVTSGSTGIPLAVRRTPLEDLVLRSFRLRVYLDYGLDWMDRRVEMRARLRIKGNGGDTFDRPHWMKLGLLRMDPVYLIETPVGEAIRKIAGYRPAALIGHADAIHRLCLEGDEGELRRLGLKFVAPEAQTVTQDMRVRMRETFGCPVHVTYGATEFNLLASQCPATGLFHLNEDGVILEVLRDGRPAKEDEEGTVVVTNLHSFAVPYIRYALDDWAVVGPERCPCGAPVRTLKEIQGRVSDFFRFSDGKRVHPFQLINPLLDFIGWLKEYRVVQVRRDAVEVWFTRLPDAPPQEAAARAIEHSVNRSTNGCVEVRAVPLETMPLSDKGKNRMFETLPADSQKLKS